MCFDSRRALRRWCAARGRRRWGGIYSQWGAGNNLTEEGSGLEERFKSGGRWRGYQHARASVSPQTSAGTGPDRMDKPPMTVRQKLLRPRDATLRTDALQ